MLKAIENGIFSWADKRNTAFLLVGYFLFPLYLLPLIVPSGPTPPFDLLFYYDAETVNKMLAAYGESIRQQYVWGSLTIDTAYPLYYGTLMAFFIAHIIKGLEKGQERLGYFVLLPYLVVICDLSENLVIVKLLSSFPEQIQWAANIAGYITSLKWILFGTTILIVLTLAIYMFFEKQQNKVS